MAMSEDTHGGEIVSTFSDKKTFEVQKRPQRLAVPDLWGFQNPEGLDGGKGYEESFKIYRTKNVWRNPLHPQSAQLLTFLTFNN
ncbi:hypothetical protein CLW00_1075 [Mongoliibacter ruber]|uniref:Uncharacterized protein n=2 Tax=Mongoliibacter ruber TaxID=1750599 RepID=A0A2T0WJR4_9BACT|nr:hypothetical protein CLW00_1075 [Mongoliibacter ruber]